MIKITETIFEILMTQIYFINNAFRANLLLLKQMAHYILYFSPSFKFLIFLKKMYLKQFFIAVEANFP